MALGLPVALSIGLPAIGLIITPGVFPDTVTLAALGQTVVQQLFRASIRLICWRCRCS